MGNIGTGKSTFCKNKFRNDEIIVCPDEWEGTNDVLQKRLFETIETSLNNGKTVVIDGNNLKRRGRDRLLYFAKKAKCPAILYDFGPGNEDSLQKRINDPRNESEDFWKVIHAQNCTDYEEPNTNEGFDEIIKINNFA